MNGRNPVTRRGFFGKGIAAALALGGLAAPVTALARRLDDEYFFKVVYDRSGRPVKVCWYDRFGKLMYCDPV